MKEIVSKKVATGVEFRVLRSLKTKKGEDSVLYFYNDPEIIEEHSDYLDDSLILEEMEDDSSHSIPDIVFIAKGDEDKGDLRLKLINIKGIYILLQDLDSNKKYCFISFKRVSMLLHALIFFQESDILAGLAQRVYSV